MLNLFVISALKKAKQKKHLKKNKITLQQKGYCKTLSTSIKPKQKKTHNLIPNIFINIINLYSPILDTYI